MCGDESPTGDEDYPLSLIELFIIRMEHHIYVEDRYTTQTVLKPSGRFYKRLAGFKMCWPDLIHYVHPGPL